MNAPAQKPEAVLKILGELDGIEQWREKQFQIFREKQIQNSQKLVEKNLMSAPKDSENVLIQHKEDLDTGEYSNDPPIETSHASFYSNTTADSSITGHILRCFNDSTENSSNVSKAVTKISMEKPKHEALKQKAGEPSSDIPCAKPFRPFLRKGTGLNRYYKPKSAKVSTSDNNSSEQQENLFVRDKKSTKSFHDYISSQRNLKEPSHKNHIHFKEQSQAILNNGTGPEIYTHQQFKEHCTNVDEHSNFTQAESDATNCTKSNHAVSNGGGNLKPGVQSGGNVNECASFPLLSLKEIAENNVDNTESSAAHEDNNDSDNLNRSADLVEFEFIEECAKNSSFNSDSSIVQRVVRGEPVLPNKQVPDKTGLKQQYAATSYPFESPFCNLNFSRVRNEALARRKQLERNWTAEPPQKSSSGQEKQMESNVTKEKKIETIHAIMSDNEKRIESLQKEMASKKDVVLENEHFGNERCSTPLCVPPELNNPLSSDLDADVAPKYVHADYMPEVNQKELYPKTKEASDALLRDSFHLMEYENTSCPPNLQQKEIKEKMREKIDELQKEIETYQELNARLKDISKERDEISRKLKKEYGDIEKYKAEQKKKVDEEVEKERQQIKRERENFQRFKKLQKENFTHKEREELLLLRKENERLQEDLKRQKNKCTSDIRRMKSQLVAAENEREESKLKVISLEEQVDDLLNALKSRRAKVRSSTRSTESNQSDCLEELQQNTDDSSSVDCRNSHEKKEPRKIPTSKTPHANKSVKVNASKPRVCFNLTPQFIPSEGDLNIQESKNPNKDNTSDEPDHSSANNELKTSADNKTEDEEHNSSSVSESSFSNTGLDKDVIERLLPSGEMEIVYPSGTKKTIKTDGTIYIEFSNGDTKYILPDKHEIQHFENGIIERSYPDGSKVTEFPDGQVQYLMPDGIKQINFPDGDRQVIHPDGFEYFEGIDGKKTIKKPDGTSIFYSENGETEIRTSTYKKREFADGSVKFIHINGRKETRYSNGRIKIKDVNGKIILDTKYMTRKR